MVPNETPFVGSGNIDIQDDNVFLHIKDIYDNIIVNAEITIVNGDSTINGISDINGCFSTFATPGIESVLSISKANYFQYSCGFILVPTGSLINPSKNLFLIIRNNAGNDIIDATIRITNDQGGIQNFIIESNEIYEEIIQPEYQNTLEIILNGEIQPVFTCTFNTFTPFSCSDVGLRIVTIISLS